MFLPTAGHFTTPNQIGRYQRAVRRFRKQQNYRANGLNGPQAMARRARQYDRQCVRERIAELRAEAQANPSYDLQKRIADLSCVLVFLRTGGYLVRSAEFVT